jgi:hypothetical protein
MSVHMLASVEEIAYIYHLAFLFCRQLPFPLLGVPLSVTLFLNTLMET